MKKRVLFIVQGFGRGHLTQAISMRQLIEQQEFEVCGVLVGGGDDLKIPDFFQQALATTHVEQFISPEFITRNDRSIRLGATLVYNIRRFKKYRESVEQIDAVIKRLKPDLIVNFYDPLAGMYMRSKKPSIPMVSIAHQYLGEHAEFRFPYGHLGERISLMQYSRLTASGSKLILALSFYPLPDVHRKNLRVVPPLLRQSVAQQTVTTDSFFLVYLAVRGYRNDIIEWHAKNPETVLHVFTDQPQDEECVEHAPGLFFHRLSDTKFLEMMAACKGLITTAGFESVCEAMYLGKPVFMIPVEGHYEQLCNSRDAFRAGAGIYDSKYNITKFVNWLPKHSSRSPEFREWADKAPQLIPDALREVLKVKHNPFHTLTDWVATSA